MDCSPPGSSVHGISQARILEWVAIPVSRGSSQPRHQTQASCIAGRFVPAEPPEKSLQRTYSDPNKAEFFLFFGCFNSSMYLTLPGRSGSLQWVNGVQEVLLDARIHPGVLLQKKSSPSRSKWGWNWASWARNADPSSNAFWLTTLRTAISVCGLPGTPVFPSSSSAGVLLPPSYLVASESVDIPPVGHSGSKPDCQGSGNYWLRQDWIALINMIDSIYYHKWEIEILRCIFWCINNIIDF